MGSDGTPQRHTCYDAQDIIDSILEEAEIKDIFWVNVNHLQEKPFEYVKWETLQKENKELKEKANYLKIENLKAKKDLSTIKESIENANNKLSELLNKTEEVKQQLIKEAEKEKMTQRTKELEEEKKKTPLFNRFKKLEVTD